MEIAFTHKGIKAKHLKRVFLTGLVVSLGAFGVYCGGSSGKLGTAESADLCSCVPDAPDSTDFRHAEKHIPIPNSTPQEITIGTILGWPQDPSLPGNAPRTGRELQVFHVAQAFVQSARVVNSDCDIHLELSANPDKRAPRVIVETPVDTEFCDARHSIQSQLQQHGFMLDEKHGGEIPQAIMAEVTGLAFEDFEHNRGSAQVATVWELHPAIVTLH